MIRESEPAIPLCRRRIFFSVAAAAAAPAAAAAVAGADAGASMDMRMERRVATPLRSVRCFVR